MTCPHCGAYVQATDVYCPNCTRSLRLTAHDAVIEAPRAQPAKTVGWIVALGLLGLCALAAFPILVVPIIKRSNPLEPPTPAFGMPPSPAAASVSTACMSNMKQVATAGLMYQGDYDDHNFLSASYQTALNPYTKNPGVYYCPQTGSAFATNGDILKLDITKKVKDPAATVYFYEGSKKTLSGPHSGMSNVAFADGHVKKYGAKAPLKWKP